MDEINQIFDRIFKRIFTFSDMAITNLINGLFGTNHPPRTARLNIRIANLQKQISVTRMPISLSLSIKHGTTTSKHRCIMTKPS